MNKTGPTFSFSIRSVYDDCKLQCRLYLPGWVRNIESAPAWSIRGAILAHPYTALGGTYDDEVISLLGGELLQEGYIVGTFNFRGAAPSEGRSSWTGRPELGDYAAFYGFMLLYLHRVKDGLHGLLSGQGRQDHTLSPTASADRNVHLILGGYSFGSLIASHAPTLDVMIDLCRTGTGIPGTPFYEIGRKARKIAATTIRDLAPANPELQSHPEHPDQIELSVETCISYLLVSPLRPPVSSLLTGFRGLSLNVGGTSAPQARPAGRPADQLCAHRTLALYGDRDEFTSVRKLRSWSAELGRMPQSRFQSGEIQGAGHFWREQGVESEARRVLREWLRPDL
ncbi:hypothetical protein N7476_007414 [Penicillium atrosanguineum]|uniref:AB hydrolase-1 domain-containing protein n=1 Tax=Penicillium atrosanguineum TaxID=1132637 RepID=A0A9W9PUG0_9EURO|nr:hypothetical protein N7526_006963 [Penicillium atrosanguineum]KAJ5311554.1 hypothetical protein N7476_007414 [Penicillium atrosanguineum]